MLFLISVLLLVTSSPTSSASGLDLFDLDDLDIAGVIQDILGDTVAAPDPKSLSPSYGYGYPPPSMSYEPQTYPVQIQGSFSSYQPQQSQSPHHGYGSQPQKQKKPMRGYGQKKKKKKKKQNPKKVYVPVVIRKKKPKKRKTIAVYKGFYIPGGTQVFGKFKKVKDCQKICEVTPNCFGADYNAWLKKCYVHTNITACEEMSSHPKLIHFKKVPCDMVDTPRGLVTLGTQIFGGLLQKGVKSLQDCIKKCTRAGSGIAATNAEIGTQICFGIDYDFATHKCYLHTDALLCPNAVEIPTPSRLVAAPSVINILICPMMMT